MLGHYLLLLQKVVCYSYIIKVTTVGPTLFHYIGISRGSREVVESPVQQFNNYVFSCLLVSSYCNHCNHDVHLVYRQGHCRNTGQCEVGLRRRAYYILSGSVLGVWCHLEGVLNRTGGHNNRMQIVRVKTREGHRLVGKYRNNRCVFMLTLTCACIQVCVCVRVCICVLLTSTYSPNRCPSSSQQCI